MKLLRLLIVALLIADTTSLLSQNESIQKPSDNASTEKKKRGTFYFSWGYNRDWYSKSDIHFKNTTGDISPVTGVADNYEFTLYDVTASDKPGFDKLLTTPLTVPQYVYRLGYYFPNRTDMGVELNFDHAKYVVDDWQTVRIKGYIGNHTYDTSVIINPDTFLHFQHTNGANFLLFNFMKRQTLLGSLNSNHCLSGVAKVGVGMVIPRTFVTMWGEKSTNFWNIAGYCAGIEAGLRYDAFRYVFLEYTAKGVFANYTNVLTVRSGRANHHFWCFENILTLGFQLPDKRSAAPHEEN